jgi:hypothetical protein
LKKFPLIVILFILIPLLVACFAREFNNELVGLWELKSALNANREYPFLIGIADEDSMFVLYDDNGRTWASTYSPTNNKGEFIMPRGMGTEFWNIAEITTNSLILSRGNSRLEFSRVTSISNDLNASDFIGTWILASENNSSNRFFVELFDNMSMRYYRQLGDDIQWKNESGMKLNRGRSWFFINNYFYLREFGVMIIESINDNYIVADLYGESVLFSNHLQLLKMSEVFVGTWELDGDDNNISGRYSGTMPLSLILNYDGTGMWHEGVETNTLNWFVDGDWLVLYETNDTVYKFEILSFNDSILVLRAEQTLIGTTYYEFTYNKAT